ncbi:MAG TPA: thiamine phosphate synthase [Beutenbergiaceae bacterium]|nr:thiamine phosphate synthase [Beutenbergiaceae bacterium]
MTFGIYLVTDPVLCRPRGVTATVAAAVAGGARTVQLRDKHADVDEHLRQLTDLAAVIDGRALLLVNDRLDVVHAARQRGLPVDGVHLGQHDHSPARARDLLGPEAVVGLSANTPAHLQALARHPLGTVDYLGVGAIRPTTTKTDHPQALGIEGFRKFAARASMPCVAIGGVRPEDVGPLRQAGANGVALVSALCAAPEPQGAARRMRAVWDRTERSTT